MNLGADKAADAITAVLQEDDDDAVDPHLERIKNEAGGDESDEEVKFISRFLVFLLVELFPSSGTRVVFWPSVLIMFAVHRGAKKLLNLVRLCRMKILLLI